MTKQHAWMLLRLIVTVLLIGIVSYLLVWIFKISYPFWIAALLVWMSYPFIRWMRRRIRFPNTLAVVLALLISLSLLGGIITGVIFGIIIGVRRISNFVPGWIRSTSENAQRFFNEQIFPLWQELTGAVDSLTPEQQTTVNEWITNLGSSAAESITENGSGLTDLLRQIVFFIPSAVVVLFFVFLGFYFIGKEWERIFSYFYKHIPPFLLTKSREFKRMFQFRVLGFIRAQVILMMIASAIVFSGLLILQVDNAFVIALIVGVAEILPYLGSGTILIPWSLYMLLTGNLYLGIGLAVLYGIAMFVRQAIEPKVLSTSMNLNALAVLIALFTGFQLFGVIGLFTGPLLLVIIVILKDIGIIGILWEFIKEGFVEDRSDDSQPPK
ncbi:sporulation integral membrane protein YtvI [Alkalicoccus urumqiensis]|uniref:Sporulation integral membrane protein YtvI n=2 Tax=Alkalicoccus urumqiensis TaxID=1548213 RepID=A0A2P6MIN1_ALKUR|nr:sporulation integral membrane protein YtvI [Alkalicoccus urumqiensis]